MKVLRIASAVAIALLTLVVTSAPAQANAVFQFYANSGDSCGYGVTTGSLIWRYSSTAPIRPVAVDVIGRIIDHPIPNENFLCRDDNYYSVASFTVYSSTVERAQVRANNEVANISLTFGSNTSPVGYSRVVVQVCRSPLYGTGPAYCGAPQYYAPPVYDPPPPR